MANKPTQSCVALADLMEATNCVDLDNRAGVVTELLFGFADEVATWPDLPAPESETPLNFAEAGVWEVDLAFSEGCNMQRLVFQDEQAELKITEAGDEGSEVVLYELDLTRYRMSKEFFGFLNAIKGRRLVLIAQDKNGCKYLMGDKLAPAKKVAGDGATTGRAATDVNKHAIKFQYYCPRYLMYAGDTEALLKPAAGQGG